jgi:putative membrane protein
MTDTREPRRPQAFAADDPSLVSEAVPEVDAPADATGTATAPDAQLARPTLADLGERGLRWGTLLVSALAGAAALGIAAWFARLVSAALVREDWLGWTTLGLLLLAALAAAMLLLREIIGYSRLARLHRLKTDVAAALRDRNQRRERKAARRWRSPCAASANMPATCTIRASCWRWPIATSSPRSTRRRAPSSRARPNAWPPSRRCRRWC